MSILIKDMEMPIDGFITVTITSDGRVVGNSKRERDKFEYLDNKDIATAVPVPPHGRPVVRGKWIMDDECRTVCSLCGNVVAFVSHPDRRWDFGNYCPNCGARMDGD